KPYRRWLLENRIELRGLFDTPTLQSCDHDEMIQRMKVFGYTREELKTIITPMAANGQEPVGSMGNDAPLAVLSDKPKLLFNYFKQMFAQVTNPPIDPLREGLVMSLMMFTGKKRNILSESPEHCKQLKLPHPIITNEDINRLRSVRRDDFKIATVPSLFDADTDDPAQSLRDGLDKMIASAASEIESGASVVIISDRGVSQNKAPIPSLLATSALHHALLERGLRADAGIIVESGEPREVMHFCLLCGYGANAINPYLAFESINDLYEQKEFVTDLDPESLAGNYINAIKKGILKTMSKMGISTLRSYHSAQLFEAVGLDRNFIDIYFTGTPSRIGGIGIDEFAEETVDRLKAAYTEDRSALPELDYGGDYSYRHDGEKHQWNPETVTNLQHAVRHNDAEAYKRFSDAANDQSEKLSTLRGLFEFKNAEPIPLDEVEPASDIAKRFCTGAMSHGSISQEAHECMAIAMNRIGGMSNTGEGGEDAKRYIPLPNGDSKNCAIKQIASG
ncbi:MAG: glutamate synthase subunit alpha, partial [Anaerohalosphaera sp.]|nr:glutamate synthase subunit alpha [Anaerohalosphaera sp.]